MISRSPKGRNKAANGQLPFIEGNARLKISRRFRDVLASIVTDLGGVERLSEGQRQMARRRHAFSRVREDGECRGRGPAVRC